MAAHAKYKRHLGKKMGPVAGPIFMLLTLTTLTSSLSYALALNCGGCSGHFCCVINHGFLNALAHCVHSE